MEQSSVNKNHWYIGVVLSIYIQAIKYFFTFELLVKKVEVYAEFSQESHSCSFFSWGSEGKLNCWNGVRHEGGNGWQMFTRLHFYDCMKTATGISMWLLHQGNNKLSWKSLPTAILSWLRSVPPRRNFCYIYQTWTTSSSIRFFDCLLHRIRLCSDVQQVILKLPATWCRSCQSCCFRGAGVWRRG